jgi:hypothetical protein
MRVEHTAEFWIMSVLFAVSALFLAFAILLLMQTIKKEKN